MKKNWMSKTVFALAVGMAVSGVATSAFAASPVCAVKNLPAKQDITSLTELLNQKQGKSKDCLPTDLLNSLLNQTKDKDNSIFQKFKNIEDSDTKSPSAPKIENRFADDSDEASVDKQKKPSMKQEGKDKASKENVSADASAMVNEVVDIVNKERAKAGLKPLSMDTELAKMATDKAKDMADNNYFDHDSPTFGSPFNMMDQYKISYQTAGENIAEGQRSAEEVMKDWMGSDGHRENIMNSSFTKIGVGYYNGYWVQEFIG
ncbi:serine protease [Brevibacillus sp. 7WMA2]|uniref:CAP domain-containing protein n=1 Tax=Brevibacillus TaxID=55080 RepID=UPI0013A73E7B|nr:MULTISPECIES: CAP domain-containing protein [Brevibacillus]MCR8995860.1 CAP domain-containing protein [Brevibacillus laterosporus]QIC06584.1 serine protease [Brevibacillus sp. 7WMA2]WPS87470.1 CAP domain-containing protein [Brevibacillus halotolerans]